MIHIYIYIYIHLATPNPATALTSWWPIWCSALILVRFVALILRAVFDPKTSIWRSLGVILALLGSILVDRAAQGTPKAAQWEKEWILGSFVRRSLVPFESIFAPKSVKTAAKVQNVGVQEAVEKKSVTRPRLERPKVSSEW